MKIKNFFKYILKLFIISTIIVSVVLLISFLRGKSPSSFNIILLRVSGAIFILGALSVLGSIKSTMSFDYQYSRSVNNNHISDNSLSDFKDRDKSFSFFFSMFIIALIVFGYGSLLSLILV